MSESVHCHFCGVKIEYNNNGTPKGVLFNNLDEYQAWHHMPLNTSAHADCYIDARVNEAVFRHLSEYHGSDCNGGYRIVEG